MLETPSSLQKKIDHLRKEQALQASFEKIYGAAYDCDLPLLKNLLAAKININAVNKNGEPVIFAAIQRAFDDPKAPTENIFNFLIENGACIDTVEPTHKRSAFVHATHLSVKQPNRNLSILEYFLKIGANPFFAPPSKQTAFEVALSYSLKNRQEKAPLFPQAEAVLELFQKNVKNLHQAVLAFNVEKVRELADEKSVQKTTDGEKPLFTAITNFTTFNSQKMLEIIKILLRKKADLNAEIRLTNFIRTKTDDPKICIFSSETYRNNYLMVATIVSIFQGNTDMIPILLNAGAKPYMLPGNRLPSAFMIAKKAANLSLAEIEMQCSQGFSKEVNKVAKNKRIAAAIVTIFEKHQQKNN